MPKKRKLPHRVYYNQGSYYYVDLDRKWHRLAKTEAEMYRALAEFKSIGGDTMSVHLIAYHKEETPKKALSTQKVEAYAMDSLIKAFGSMYPASIQPKHVYEYHRLRSLKASASANREKSLLSSVLNRLMMQGIINSNPCVGVKKNPAKPRKRYVTDFEFSKVREHACPVLQAAMDIALLTGLRMGDILALTEDDVLEDGLHCQTSKTSRALIFSWSNALVIAIEHARLSGKGGVHIISNKHGQRYTASGFKSLWQRTIKRVCHFESIDRFQFRDLRTKAACDSKENASRLLGHSSDKITKKYYDVLPWRVSPN